MDDKPNQAAELPIRATDQVTDEVKDETTNEAPTVAEQGVEVAAVQDEIETVTMEDTAGEATTADETAQANAEDTEAGSDAVEATPETPAEISAESAERGAEAVAAEAERTTEVTTESAAEPTTESTAEFTAAQGETAQDEPTDVVQSQGGQDTEQDTGQNEDEIITMEQAMTMEDVMAASDDQNKPIHRGMILSGTVIMLAQDGIVVDVGAKIEGLVPYNQLFEHEVKADEAAQHFKSGDDIQVYVVRADIPNSTIILSKKRADQERAWNLLNEIFEKKLPVEVEIVEKVRGGLVANLGVRAFLPASQVDVRRVNDLSPYVDKRLKVRIIELNRKRNRVIISRRSIIEDEISEQKGDTLQKLEPGAKMEGEVVEITDFGVFVNLGGIDGLVHRSEIGYGRFNHPREVLNVGDKVKVEVLDMDLERERINLSMKKLIADPWENVLATYHIGQKVGGKVTNLTPFGAFVEIEPGLEGLIHVSEMSWTKRVRHPKEVVDEGHEVEAMILKIDMGQKRISLGLRQTQPDPWSSLPDHYPPGTEVTGPITGLTDFGVFMEIEEGIEGLIHISELAHDHIEDVSQHFQKGDEVTAVILNIDPIEQRASLSRKRLMPYTASEFAESTSSGGAPGASRGASPRKGRRGGRRGAGIDYDYSYASSDAGAKTTTKLGDVYADLFAQFGLSDSKRDEDDQTEAASSAAETEAAQNEAASSAPASTETETSAETETAYESERSQEQAAQPTPSSQQDAAPTAEAESESEPEDAIDAAEAAALLTAAFRQGRRPVVEQREEEAEKSEA